jgi:hypothetical protein
MTGNKLPRRAFVSLLAAVPIAVSTAARALAAQSAPHVRRIGATSTRDVEVTSWRAVGQRKGTIAFSPGFGSSPRFYPDFIQAWTQAGYEVIAPLHVDSREYPQPGVFAGPAIWATRIEDMRAVARSIEGRYISAGHSFGALGALVLGGAGAVVPTGITGPLADKRVTAVLAFSPPPPAPTLITEAGYAMLARPALIQTGTRDVLPSAASDPQSWRGHLTAFARSAPTRDHYGLVLEGVDHYFGGLICDPSKQGPDQRSTLRLAIGASLAFLDRHGSAADGSPSIMSPSFPIDPRARYYLR